VVGDCTVECRGIVFLSLSRSPTPARKKRAILRDRALGANGLVCYKTLHFDLYMCSRIIFGCVSVRVSEFFEFSHEAQTRGHPYTIGMTSGLSLYNLLSCIGDIVAIMLDLRTLLSVSSTCGTVCQQTVWIFPPLCHSNVQSNKLILRRFFLVRRLRLLYF